MTNYKSKTKQKNNYRLQLIRNCRFDILTEVLYYIPTMKHSIENTIINTFLKHVFAYCECMRLSFTAVRM